MLRVACQIIPRNTQHFSQHFDDDVRLAPQFFEPVVVAHLFGEQVNNHVAVVEDRPAAALTVEAIDALRAQVLLELELFQQVVFDGFGLAFVVDGGEDEVAGEGSLLVNIEQHNVGGLFLLNDVHNLVGKLQAIQRLPPVEMKIVISPPLQESAYSVA